MDTVDSTASVVNDDIGFIENLTLLPTSFTTGSYGWKGSKRITVELQGGDDDDDSGKEKVQVMLSYALFPHRLSSILMCFFFVFCRINATVIGSKPSEKINKGAKKPEEYLGDANEEDVASDGVVN